MAAKLRLTLCRIREIIFIDQFCGQREGGGRCVLMRGARRTIVGRPDSKGEKVHALCGIGNGWKSPIVFLPVRRPPQPKKPGAKRAQARTLATGRRPKGATAAARAANAKLNKANEGETWTSKKMLAILMSPEWLPQLKAASGVVLDNAPCHKEVVAALMKAGVRILAHPAHSPDMNVIEKVHFLVKNRNSVAVKNAKNNAELQAAYKATWDALKPDCIDGFCKGYHDVMRAIIAKKGGPTES